MILTDREIKAAIESHQIDIDPRPEGDAFSSTSVDLTLGKRLKRWKTPLPGAELTIDPTTDNYKYTDIAESDTYTETEELDENGFILDPGEMVLLWTDEQINLPNNSRLAARVEGKSSLARLGVAVHITAPTIHAGFNNTLQLEVVHHGKVPVRLKPAMPICQIIFEMCLGVPEKGYSGQFQKSRS